MEKYYSHKLSPFQRQVLVGTLLGDAHLRANSKKTLYQYVVLQSGFHKEYVFHLYEIFKNCTPTPPKEYTFEDKRFPGKTYTRWSFYTSFQSCFRFYAHQFYKDVESEKISSSIRSNLSPKDFLEDKSLTDKSQICNQRSVWDVWLQIEDLSVYNGKQKNVSYKRCKKVPKLIHKYLTPIAIAYWYMDDGAPKWKKRSLGVRFCTDGFTLSEIDRLSKVLREKYNYKTSLQKKGSSYRIYISSDSYPILKNCIYPFLIPSMTYKFPIE